jgi:hypothetical protein
MGLFKLYEKDYTTNEFICKLIEILANSFSCISNPSLFIYGGKMLFLSYFDFGKRHSNKKQHPL